MIPLLELFGLAIHVLLRAFDLEIIVDKLHLISEKFDAKSILSTFKKIIVVKYQIGEL